MPRTRRPATTTSVQTRRGLARHASDVGHTLADHASAWGTQAHELAKRMQASTSQGARQCKDSIKAHPAIAIAATAAVGGLVAFLVQRHRKR